MVANGLFGENDIEDEDGEEETLEVTDELETEEENRRGIMAHRTVGAGQSITTSW